MMIDGNFCSVRRFPKPAPPVLTTGAGMQFQYSNLLSPGFSDSYSRNGQINIRMKQIIPQSKPFLIDVVIKRGTFQIFSLPAHLTEPVLQWQNDLVFMAESTDRILMFKKIEISGRFE